MFNLNSRKKAVSKTLRNSVADVGWFAKREEGGLTIFALFAFFLLLAAAGIAVDVMNYERDRAKLQWALDNAVLSAASLEQTLDPAQVVEAHLAASGLGEYASSISVEDKHLDRTVRASLTSGFDTNFMRLSGVETISLGVNSAAHEAAPCTEISMVLDISGSMGNNQRLTQMQTAAKAFVTKTLEHNNDPGTECATSVSVIPFAGQTNPGSVMFEYLGGERFGTTTDDDFFPEWKQDISNVVFWFDTDGNADPDFSVKIDSFPDNETDLFNKDDVDTYYHYVRDFIINNSSQLPESAELVGASIKGGKQETMYYSIDRTTTVYDEASGPTKFNNVDIELQYSDFHSYVGNIPNNTSSCLEMTYSDFLNTSLPSGSIDQTPYFVNWEYDETTQNWGWCPEDEMSIQYAQNDETKLHTFIDGLRLFDGTGTNYSLKYALALLDPSSQDEFAYLSKAGEVPSEFADRPLSWDHENSSKIIVIMTDGQTTPQVRPADEMEEENGLTELTARPSEDSTIASSQLTNLQLFQEQCELAKTKGAVVYTVAFETTEQAASEIRTCASSWSHYYEVTGEEIIDSFVSIAGSIQKLRLIQ